MGTCHKTVSNSFQASEQMLDHSGPKGNVLLQYVITKTHKNG